MTPMTLLPGDTATLDYRATVSAADLTSQQKRADTRAEAIEAYARRFDEFLAAITVVDPRLDLP